MTDQPLALTVEQGLHAEQELLAAVCRGECDSGVLFWRPTDHALGHCGWGGSCAFADPRTGVSAAYVMTRQSPHLIGDPRAQRLIDALYSAL